MPTSPVSNGIMPSQPRNSYPVRSPDTANPIRPIPANVRSERSVSPTFADFNFNISRLAYCSGGACSQRSRCAQPVDLLTLLPGIWFVLRRQEHSSAKVVILEDVRALSDQIDSMLFLKRRVDPAGEWRGLKDRPGRRQRRTGCARREMYRYRECDVSMPSPGCVL